MKRILWETYFDTSITKKMGRRVRKNFPSHKLFDILNSMNITYTTTDARYPRLPTRTVKKIEVEWDESKEKLIKKIESSSSSVT